MKKSLHWIIRHKGVLGLYLVNFMFQKVLKITSNRVNLLHFTNVISAEQGLMLVGHGEFAEHCLRINGGIMIQAANGVRLDRSVLLGPGVKIISGNHDLNDFSKPATSCGPIEIDSDCWIGANAIILPEVRLLPRTIVGAGSVINRSFDVGNIVVAGNPAKIVRYRTDSD